MKKPRAQVRYVDAIPVPKPNRTYLKRVISGGQIGVDYAGVSAARAVGFRTGGHMPQGFKTLEGMKRGYSWMFGMKDDCPDYRTRTWRNVEEADATIRIALDFNTPGEWCTLHAIRAYKKPHLDIYFKHAWLVDENVEFMLKPDEVATWIVENRVRILNIAGNANPNLGVAVYHYLIEVFNMIRWE